jgi:hypothetical protein
VVSGGGGSYGLISFLFKRLNKSVIENKKERERETEIYIKKERDCHLCNFQPIFKRRRFFLKWSIVVLLQIRKID